MIYVFQLAHLRVIFIGWTFFIGVTFLLLGDHFFYWVNIFLMGEHFSDWVNILFIGWTFFIGRTFFWWGEHFLFGEHFSHLLLFLGSSLFIGNQWGLAPICSFSSSAFLGIKSVAKKCTHTLFKTWCWSFELFYIIIILLLLFIILSSSAFSE